MIGKAPPTTQADLDSFSQALVTLATTSTAGLDAAFPLPGGAQLTVVVTREVSALGVSVAVLAAEKVWNPLQPTENVTSTVWAGIEQAIVTTSYGIAPADMCAIPEVQKAMVDGIVSSLPAAKLATSNYLSCAADGDNAVFTMMTAFKGTEADNAALIAAASAAPFSVCTQAYTNLCPTLASVTSGLGVPPQQAVCILNSGTCPPNCPTGTWRAGETTADCNYALGGYFTNSTAAPFTMLKCPADTFAPNTPARNLANGDADAESCSPCPTGTTTNGKDGQSSCAFVLPGFFFDGTAAQPCPVNTSSPDTRPAKTATSCTPCPDGTTTWGLTGQAACSSAGDVPPGFYFDGSANVACPAGTFAPFPRPQASAGSCYPCQTLVAFSDRNPITGEVYQLVATESINAGTACKCPANTYFSVGSNPAAPAAACVACPQGTSGGEGAVGVAACTAQCKAGYWGEPAAPAYGSVCRACPTIAPGNAGSATTGAAPAPVPQSACTACSFPSDGSGAPAVCTACGSNAGGAGCGSCVVGYYGASCENTCDPANFALTAVPGLSPKGTDQKTACGGCVGGKMGDACTDLCPGGTPNVTDAVYVTIQTPTNDASNCVFGCPPGKGIKTVGSVTACVACGAGEFSPGTKADGVHPVCMLCPPGSEPTDGAARCKTTAKAALDATEEGLFDEFD